jgi:hypothetical protein
LWINCKVTTMGIRLLFASASLLLLSALPASADWDRHRDRHDGWPGRQHQSFSNPNGLKRACDFGDRRACVRLGEIIGSNREAQRRRDWRGNNRHDGFGRRDWQSPTRFNRPPPPSVWWRFDVR